MNGRELLEMAAKAAGIAGTFIEELPEAGHPRYRCGIGKVGAVTTMWNSLATNQDAFSLAVDMGMSVSTEEDRHTVVALHGVTFCEPHGTDKHAATRRAITRAAAEIGKSI